MKSSDKKKPLAEKKQQKYKERDATVSKMTMNGDKDVMEIIRLQKDPFSDFKGQKIQISSNGSKSAPSYVEILKDTLQSNKKVMVFGFDKALCKLVTTVELLRKQIPEIKKDASLSMQQGRSKLSMMISLT